MLCAKAQTLVMKMQQATNSQVGLPGQVRDDWFQKLKDVAQLFVQAQVISTKLEQTSTTEKAQLQGALSAAISERDLAVSQTEAAQQEIQMLRSRLDELFRTGGPHAMTQGNAEQNEGHQASTPPLFRLSLEAWLTNMACSAERSCRQVCLVAPRAGWRPEQPWRPEWPGGS